MAPFIDPGDARVVLVLYAAVLLAAFTTHRAARAVPAIRTAFPAWESWSRRDFPMGLALGGTLIFYLALGAVFGKS
jgi:prepilin peptidase CpaA